MRIDDTNFNKKYRNLQEQIVDCRLCQETFGFQPHPIVSGNPNAKIMQISQAPSLSVHNTGKPFNDASGRRLRKEWYHIEDEVFYNPDNFYITSIAHCYPGKSASGGDRQPPKLCAETWLKKELDFVQNEIYLLIGGYAAKHFFPGQTITTLAFENKEINGKPAYILPHPSPLNIKWFKDYPDFLEKRIFEIDKEIHRVLKLPL